MSKKHPTMKSPAGLPQKPDHWLVAARQSRHWVTEVGKYAARPYLLVILAPEAQSMLGIETFTEKPSATQVKETLFKYMLKPARSSHLKPHRPQKVIFEEQALADALNADLHAIGVEASFQAIPEMDAVIDEFNRFAEKMNLSEDEEMPELAGLMEVPGMTPQIVQGLFTAAAAFFRAAPWERLEDSQPLAVSVGESGQEGKPGYVQLMGNAGVQMGLLLYWDWADVLRTYENRGDPLQMLPSYGWNSLSYETCNAVPYADLDAIEQYNLEIAAPTAYPMPGVYLPKSFDRPPLDMLQYFEALLHAIPLFVAQLKEEDYDYQPLEASFDITTSTGPRHVNIRYPAGELPAALFLGEGEDLFDFDEEFEEEGDEEFFFEDEEDEDEEEAPPFLDRRGMEKELAQLSRMLDAAGDYESPLSAELQKAQEIMYRAWDEQKSKKRIQLAHQALELSADCADAYVMLAEEEAENAEEAYEFYKKGVEAGERTLGQEYFAENKGHFWGLLETRPYMRARQGMAECLGLLGHAEETLNHYQEMLELNPNDNQGIRYLLLTQLMVLGRGQAAQNLIDRYRDDGSACWAYWQALLTYQNLGPTPQADAKLRKAIKINRHVPAYLTGRKEIPEELPEYIGLGDENEAIDYVVDSFGVWWQTRGAVAWLQSKTK